MSLKDQILADIKSAMKSKEQLKLETLRFLNSAIKNREIELRPGTITEVEIQNVIKKLVKQRKESIEQFAKAGRQDLVEKETQESTVLESYLPVQMGKEQLEKVVSEVLTATGATSVKQMGLVMKEVMARIAGAADNKMVSEIVRSKLS